MAPPSTASNPNRLALGHDASLLDLIQRLSEVEFERGRLMAQLEFHLNIRQLAVYEPPPPAPAVSSAKDTSPRVQRKRGELEAAVLEALKAARPTPLTVAELADRTECTRDNMRLTLVRMQDKKLVEMGQGRTWLPAPAGV